MSTQSTTPEASPTLELPGFCNLGLQQAMEFERVSLATLVSLSSYAIDFSKSASLFSPIAFSPLPGDFFDVAAKAYASFFDLQRCWLTLLMPQAAPAGAANQGDVRATAQALETGMDKVVGARAGRKS